MTQVIEAFKTWGFVLDQYKTGFIGLRGGIKVYGLPVFAMCLISLQTKKTMHLFLIDPNRLNLGILETCLKSLEDENDC
jgi:hypothetical protein